MARKHGGLGRGLDALIPMREEVEKAMKMADSESVEILFADEDETDLPVQEKKENDSVFRRNESVFEEKKETAAVLSEKEEADSQNQKDDVSRETSEVKAESTPEKKDKTSKDADTDSLKNAVTVRISEVEPNRKQPRKNFDDEKLDELAESIKNFGLLQPILVQKRDGYYEIIAGERRWRAALKAGLKEVPVIIREYTEKEILELSLIENLQRENLNPIEEAQAYKRLMDEFGMGQADVAQRVSKSRSAVANSLRLLKLEEEVQKMLVEGQISMGHARALLPLEIPEEQVAVAGKVAEKQLSVRETEKLVKELLKTGADAGTKETGQEEQKEDPSIEIIYKQIEERLQQTLHTKVAIQRKRNGHGKLLIDFYNSDDLEKIIDRLTDH